MKVIGITGGTGAGKTTALESLESMGAVIIDCDAVYYSLLESSEPMVRELHEQFPEAVTDGKLDRKKLGKIVFASPYKLKVLNKITHAYVLPAVRDILSDEKRKLTEIVAIDAIALFESGLDAVCDLTVAVAAPREKRVERIMEREKIGREYAEMRIAAQQPDSYYRERCDFVLTNDYEDKNDFMAECIKYFTEVLRSG